MVRPALCAGTSRDAAVLASAGSAMSTANPGREAIRPRRTSNATAPGLRKTRSVGKGQVSVGCGDCLVAEIAGPLLSVPFNSLECRYIHSFPVTAVTFSFAAVVEL